MPQRDPAPQEPRQVPEPVYESVTPRDLAQDELELLFSQLMEVIAKRMPEGSARATVMQLLGRAYEWAARYL